ARADRDPVLAAELAAVAWHNDPENPAARTALADRYAALSGTDAVVAGAPGGPPFQALRAGGDVLMTASEQGIGFVRGVRGPKPTPWEPPEPAGIERVLPVLDGSRVAVLAGDGSLRLWDVGASAPAVELIAPGSPVMLVTDVTSDGARLGWLVREGPDRALLHVRDVRAGTTDSFPIAIGAGETAVQLTSDPGLVAVRVGTGPDAHRFLHPLAGGADRPLPAGTSLQAGGALTTTCVEATRDGFREDQLVVHDVPTGAERQRIALGALGCMELRYTADGRYVVEVVSSTTSPDPAELIRFTDLVTGVSYQALVPVSEGSTDEKQQVAALPDGPGDLIAFVADGPTVLRIPAERVIRPDPTSHTWRYDVPGAVLAEHRTSDVSTELTTYDPSTGRQIATLPSVVIAGGGWFARDALWTLGRKPEGWSLDRYELPALTRTWSAPLPSSPPTGAAMGSPGLAVSDEEDRVLVTFTDGLLSAWDGRTGRPLGPPTPVTVPPEFPRMWPSDDRPGQVFLRTPAGLEVWDAVAGRRLATLDAPADGITEDAAARGDQLVHRSAGQLEIWDLATQQRRTTIPVPDVGTLVGSTPDGRLAENRGDEIVF
ncbi:MAG: hypothetical protein ACRDQ0_15715, partial [Pseudonocardia sp.]